MSQAEEELAALGFSEINVESEDGSIIWNDDNWIVTSQSIDAGIKVNANGKIVLKAKPKEESEASSTS